ncbi:MFS polyamine transporter [Lentinula guzmanii]|uniref:MFS polyamine transporter n=2 Tax=Lentinula TaxID=5352 RepID=A0AA38JHA9_9AGAR|nr:MFS polyamine transporter [Lentinula guzmanii]KAJ3786462.1 MFS polyamine transporter [Lentinula aff. detonsa]
MKDSRINTTAASLSPGTSTIFVEPEFEKGVVVKSAQEIEEPNLDPRLGLSNTPSSKELNAKQRPTEVEVNYSEQNEPLYIEFEQGDPRNPVNFLPSKKWAITVLACFSTLLASSNASTYNLGFDSMSVDLDCTEFQATIGLSLYALGFGIVPLVTASFSEEIGRQPLYYISATGVLLMYIAIALAQNIQTVLIARFIQGAFGSTWATMVGGTIADIWQSHERGLPMSLFAVAAVGGTGLGPIYAGWIEMNSRLQWRWIQWIQMIITGFYLILVPIIMKETRSSIILIRIAKRMRKKTGNPRYRARIEDERAKLSTLIWVSCTRPIHLLTTEPVVASFSIWIGFVWGVFFCMIESIGSVFQSIHKFNTGQVGTVFVTFVIGSILGFSTNLFQERLYRKNYPTRGPEARLYLACCAAILIPCGMFIYAWSTFPHVPWIALTIGITIFIYGAFIIYLAVFTYLADCYGPFASSALAGQSLCRNLAATAFPLFTQQMYAKLSYKWANTLFGCIACILMPIPFILFFYGPRIRSRSKLSRVVMQSLEELHKK